MMNLLQNRHFGMRPETIRDHKCLSWIRRRGYEGGGKRASALRVPTRRFPQPTPDWGFWSAQICGNNR